MAFIVSRMLKKGFAAGTLPRNNDDVWMQLMLSPYDYGAEALRDKETRTLMQKIGFSHGGKEYDDKYPDGIPTSLQITLKSGQTYLRSPFNFRFPPLFCERPLSPNGTSGTSKILTSGTSECPKSCPNCPKS